MRVGVVNESRTFVNTTGLKGTIVAAYAHDREGLLALSRH
jgi:hypothetical protein